MARITEHQPGIRLLHRIDGVSQLLLQRLDRNVQHLERNASDAFEQLDYAQRTHALWPAQFEGCVSGAWIVNAGCRKLRDVQKGNPTDGVFTASVDCRLTIRIVETNRGTEPDLDEVRWLDNGEVQPAGTEFLFHCALGIL